MSAELLRATLAYPAIDNHAHPLLSNADSNALPFEGTISDANGEALINDAPNTLACSRAAIQLKKLFGMRDDESWADVKAKRASMDYVKLCRLCFQESNIHCILIDDGLAPKQELESLGWHDQFTKQRIRRIVRVETEAEVRLFPSSLDARTLSVMLRLGHSSRFVRITRRDGYIVQQHC
jgi:hypothetical protein